MRDFFTRHATATWPEPELIHVYLRANDELRSVVHLYHEELTKTGVAAQHGLGLQDLECLHFTVQMLTLYRREVPQEQLDKLVTRLTADLRLIETFVLRVGPPQPSVHAVELWVDPVADRTWTRLVDTVRDGVADVLGPESIPPVAGNATPHTSIGYGTGDGDSGVIMSTLKRVEPRPTLVEVAVSELELVAVTQHPAEGRFSWDTLATLPVGS